MTRVKDQTIGDYLQALASTAAVPGGGSAAALAAAMGAALVSMVAKLSAKKARTDKIRAALTGLVPELDQLADRLLELSQDDIDAYRAVIDARKSGAPAASLERAYERAAEVPLAAASAATHGLALAAETGRNSPPAASCCRRAAMARWPMWPSTCPSSAASRRYGSSAPTAS